MGEYKYHETARVIRRQVGEKVWKNSFKFAFVRNPWDLVVSEYFYSLKMNKSDLAFKNISFNEWVKRCFKDKDPYYTLNGNLLRVQNYWISDDKGNLIVDFIGRVESFEEDLQTVCQEIGKKYVPCIKENTSLHQHYSVYYTKTSRDIVAEHYKEDINIFGYSFEESAEKFSEIKDFLFRAILRTKGLAHRLRSATRKRFPVLRKFWQNIRPFIGKKDPFQEYANKFSYAGSVAPGKFSVLLVGNYHLDKQISMKLIADMLFEGLSARGIEVTLLCPHQVIGLGGWNEGIFSKITGYIDKLVIFPFHLKKMAKKTDIVHVTDHSNAFYIGHLGDKLTLVTCHDVLALKGAFGENLDCKPSWTGQFLQKWILKGLNRADAIACVSAYTRRELLPFIQRKEKISVIMEGLNRPFRIKEENYVRSGLSELDKDIMPGHYILHVGTNHRRKNREGLIRIFAKLKDRWGGRLVLVGSNLDERLKDLCERFGITDRISDLGRIDFNSLELLYNGAFTFVYPSRFEGYGWPIIEAQSCGCPVVCSSDCGPFSEIVDGSAVLCDSSNEEGFAEAILSLQDVVLRKQLIAKGLENVKRFSRDQMIDSYLELYEKLLNRQCGG